MFNLFYEPSDIYVKIKKNKKKQVILFIFEKTCFQLGILKTKQKN